MAQQPSELKAHIKAENESLRENLEEIQSRVKSALDWRVWYRNNTAIALGGVVAGGLLLSLLLPKGSGAETEFIDTDDRDGRTFEPVRETRPRSQVSSRFHDVLDNTMSAIFGVANDTFQDFMSKAIPGFGEHYSRASQTRRFE
jgi:hypothetical protein